MHKILLTTLITTGFLFSAHIPSSEDIESDYLKWEKNENNNLLKKSKDKKVEKIQSKVTVKTKRQELMDSQYKAWNESSLSNPSNVDTYIIKEEKIENLKEDPINKINTSLTLKYGKCILENKLDKSILLQGNCSLLIHTQYPKQYIFSFNNSRTFFFQNENNKWLLKQEKTEDSPATFDNNSFSTSNYEISFK